MTVKVITENGIGTGLKIENDKLCAETQGFDCETISQLPEKRWESGMAVLGQTQDGECVRVTSLNEDVGDLSTTVRADKTSGIVGIDSTFIVTVAVNNNGLGKSNGTLQVTFPQLGTYTKTLQSTNKSGMTVQQNSDIEFVLTDIEAGGTLELTYKVEVSSAGGYTVGATVIPDNIDLEAVNNYAQVSLNVVKQATGTQFEGVCAIKPVVKLLGTTGQGEDSTEYDIPVFSLPEVELLNSVLTQPEKVAEWYQRYAFVSDNVQVNTDKEVLKFKVENATQFEMVCLPAGWVVGNSTVFSVENYDKGLGIFGINNTNVRMFPTSQAPFSVSNGTITREFGKEAQWDSSQGILTLPVTRYWRNEAPIAIWVGMRNGVGCAWSYFCIRFTHKAINSVKTFTENTGNNDYVHNEIYASNTTTFPITSLEGTVYKPVQGGLTHEVIVKEGQSYEFDVFPALTDQGNTIKGNLTFSTVSKDGQTVTRFVLNNISKNESGLAFGNVTFKVVD